MGSTFINILSIVGVFLILGGIGVLIYYMRANKRSASAYKAPSYVPRSEQDELNALGILEIRPKEKPAEESEIVEEDRRLEIESTEKPAEGAEEESGDEIVVEEPDEISMSSYAREGSLASNAEEKPLSSIAEKETAADQGPAERTSVPVSNRGGVSRREALFRLLNAVQASVDGHTACLIKRQIDGRCHVEAIVSQNPVALDAEAFSMDVYFANDKILENAVSVVEIGADEFGLETLQYYSEPVPVRQLAIAPVKGADSIESYFLLVDALGWQDLDDPWQRLMIGQFATLIGTFLATPISEEDSGEFVRPRIRPRREIIAEEMNKARSEDQPLALALIYLNRAEEVASAGPKALVDAERQMAARLEDAVNGGRLERFGELTYGVFHAEDVGEVETWALQLQEELLNEGSHFDGGVSIGIALLQERHQGADEFRADATEALREAYETGACTIIE